MRRVFAPFTAHAAAPAASAMRFASGGAKKEGKFAALSDEEVIGKLKDGSIKFYGLEDAVAPDYTRAIKLRREFVKSYVRPSVDSETKVHAIDTLPYEDFDWSRAVGQNCENIIGYVPVPVGLAGPILMDGVEYAIPMATTEGALVASTHRGARAINMSGGCVTRVLTEGMTRAPVVEVDSIATAFDLKEFCDKEFQTIKAAFESTTRFGKLLNIKVAIAGRKVFIRFRAFTGDAMGMNMVTKGVDAALNVLQQKFPSLKVLALSGNYCTDKKPSAINWVEGRGKSVIAEAVVKKDYVEKTLKTTVDALVQLNVDKNLTGSAMAGSLGGFNAQAANVVAAMFLAMGQDPAQVVESATCLTSITKAENGDLLIAVTMPSIEVGTIGGGTGLPAQKSMLELVGCAGSNHAAPGSNASLLARVIACGVLSAELSLMSGLAAGHLLRAHMDLNRAKESRHLLAATLVAPLEGLCGAPARFVDGGRPTLTYLPLL
eukprot:CAMPEP_0174850844 /NCGR_PEP_ID=MMETSP1114-20130205/21166_1 /TAXON_ID=312471 /ORGANISM="Neobodo designis, Strain CCAP 1951/1" /LENGTH=489 /DNA_ID=CAMNT_0016085331 /DNA_START=40 /DNA_END=1510 /DNA_ORIENTATION=+